jgi:RNA polymerase sigma factor (sigma-70 family)
MLGDGDPSAFAALYMEMRQSLVDHILWQYSPTLSEVDAEDIIHNTFLVIHQHASRFRGAHNNASARSWMYKIARSEAMKMIKVMKRTDSLDGLCELDGRSENGPAVPERSLLSDLNWKGEDSAENRAMNKTILEKAVSSIRKFPVEDQALLGMRFVEECTFDQIGQHIGRTKPRAKQRHDGLIAKLRKALGVDPSED